MMGSRDILVTGGAGFIGSHLVDALVADGHRVAVLDNLSTGRRENLESVRDRVELLVGDVRDAEACRTACRGRDLVFHLAAVTSVPLSLEDPVATIEANVVGSSHVFTACRDAGVRRTVYASSSSVYGDNDSLPKVEGEEGRLLSPYAASKKMVEDLAAVFCRCYGQDLVGLRFFNVYGPRQQPDGDYAAVVPRFFRACLRGEPPLIYGDGRQTRDFTAVEDTVRALRLAGEVPAAAGGLFNIGGGRTTTINELAERIARITGCTLAPERHPPRPGDVRHSYADGTRSAEVLGYRPELDLEAGLAAALEHYRARFAPRAASPVDP